VLEGPQIQYGPVGPQSAPEGRLPGWGTQVQIQNFADRFRLGPVGPRVRIKER
jgi:hypothetical protein